jgi:type I restriction enzyme S subunit
MAEHKTTPQIRFKGFSDDWENLKVVDILVERNTQAPKTDEYPLMSFVASYGVVPKGDRYNREFLVNDEMNKKYKQTEFGDFIYSSNNLETGSIGLNNYGKASISPVYSIFQPTEYGVSDFIGRLLIRKSFINQMIRWRQGVIYGQWRIHESDFMQIEIVVPLPKEQAEIGNFLKNLDTLIDLHQRKYDKLIQLKKAMLEKMFPKNGSKAPEIRFTGFSDDWEECQLSEIVDVYDGTHQTPNYTDSGIMFLSVENVKTLTSQKFISKEDFQKEFKIFPQRGDVLMTRIGDIGTANIVDTDSPIAYYVTLALLKNKGLDSYFLKESIHSNSVKKELWHRTLHIAFPKKINKNEIEKVLIRYPVVKREQEKIGAFFKDLDNLINLHQRKYDKLIQLKKAMLEKMFV